MFAEQDKNIPIIADVKKPFGGENNRDVEGVSITISIIFNSKYTRGK